MRIILFIILILIMMMGDVSAQVNEVFLPSIANTDGPVRLHSSRPSGITFNTSGAAENPNASQNSAFVLSSELSQSIGYLAIGGALLGFYFLIRKSRPMTKEVSPKKP